MCRRPHLVGFFGLQDINKQKDRSKTKAEEGRQKREEETRKHENPNPFGGVSLSCF